MKFLWRGRPPKVSQHILRQKIENGGLKAIDLELFCRSLHMAWIKRLYLCQDSPWRKILQARLGAYKITDLIRSCLGADEIKRFRIPKFYRELLIDFQTYANQPLNCPADVLKESLWYNRSIRIDGRSVFLKSLYRAGIKNIR